MSRLSAMKILTLLRILSISAVRKRAWKSRIENIRTAIPFQGKSSVGSVAGRLSAESIQAEDIELLGAAPFIS